jgi:hypothetical protein
MEFLYGDSTPSPLSSNFLEFLRDAIDFGVFALHTDDAIAAIREQAHAAGTAADEETDRLDALGRAVSVAVDTSPKGGAESETSRCAVQLAATSADAVGAAVAAVRERLERRRAELSLEEGGQREACFKALEALLLRHSPPESEVSVRVDRAERGYAASRHGETRFGLRWRVDLGIPQGHAFGGETPMERLAPHVEIHAPEQVGWLKKEVRHKLQRIDRLVLTGVVDDGRTVMLRLRSDLASAQGLEFEVDPDGGKISAARSGPTDDPTAGPFEVAAEDVPKLVALAERVRAACAELTASRLVEATLGDLELKQEPSFSRLVEQLVAFMAPIVHEVARHSLTSNELVLRRQISSERREEIYVAKSTLRDKVMPLRPELRGLFGRLGLDTIPPSRPSSRPSAPPTPEENDWPQARAELPRSEPPPPLRSSRPPPQQ